MKVKCSNKGCGLITELDNWIFTPNETSASLKISNGHCPRCFCGSYYSVKPGEVEKPLSGAQLVTLERTRQMKVEGWSPEHDDKHKKHELALAASSYIAAVASPDEWAAEHGEKPGPSYDWPWTMKWWKPSADPIRNLVKAGALIAAEIDRLQRAAPKEVKP